MKKILISVSLICLLLLTLGSAVGAVSDIRLMVDFSAMDPVDNADAEMLEAYEVLNVKIALFNSEGNILAAANNGSPSYVIYRIATEEDGEIKNLTLRSFASINDFVLEDVGHEAGNVFGIYVKDTPDFDFSSDRPLVEGMVGKRNHTWDLSKNAKGCREVYVCIYFENNSSFVDWVRFYTFDFTATVQAVGETEPPETEKPAPATEKPKEETQMPVTESAAPVVTAPVTEPAAPQEKAADPIAVILIAAGSLIAVIIVVTIIVMLRKKNP